MAEASHIDSEDFLDRLRAGDRDAHREVVQAYLPQILRAALGAGLEQHDAEDAAQETFVTFLEKAELFEGRSKVRTFLFGILYRKIHEARRGIQKSDRQDDIDEVYESRFDEDGAWSTPPASADEQVYAAQVREYLDRCMEDLSERHRMAFVFREVEEMPTEEICKILDVTRTNLGVILFRARNRLRECLESQGVRR